jgi:hypothetical protein
MIDVLPIDRYEEPELAGLVEIWAWRRRSSFQRRPSRRSLVRGYVVEVSRGIFAVGPLSFQGSSSSKVKRGMRWEGMKL